MHEIVRKGSRMSSVLDKGFDWEDRLVEHLQNTGLPERWHELNKAQNPVQAARDELQTPNLNKKTVIDLEKLARTRSKCRCKFPEERHDDTCKFYLVQARRSRELLHTAEVGKYLLCSTLLYMSHSWHR